MDNSTDKPTYDEWLALVETMRAKNAALKARVDQLERELAAAMRYPREFLNRDRVVKNIRDKPVFDSVYLIPDQPRHETNPLRLTRHAARAVTRLTVLARTARPQFDEVIAGAVLAQHREIRLARQLAE